MRLILLVVTLFPQISLTAHILGSGYDSESGCYRDSPVLVSQCFRSGQSGTFELESKIYSKRETKEVIAEANAGVGTRILGVELLGRIYDNDELFKNSIACELSCEWHCTVRMEEFSRSFELASRQVEWNNRDFQKKYGDRILFSFKEGGSIKIILLAHYRRDVDETNINLQAKAKILFAKVKLGEIRINTGHRDSDFDFALIIDQKGGDQRELIAFKNELDNLPIRNGLQCQRVLSAALSYVKENYSQQVQDNPAIWDRCFIPFDDPQVSHLWVQSQNRTLPSVFY